MRLFNTIKGMEYETKNKVLTLFEFLFWWRYFYLVPVIGDRWASGEVYDTAGGMIRWGAVCLDWVKNVNGRFLGMFFTGIIEQNMILYSFICALIVSLTIYSLSRFGRCDKDSIFINIYSFTSLLLVSDGIRQEVYNYAFVLYMIPVALGVVLCKQIEQVWNEEKKGSEWVCYAIISILSFWIEHVSVALLGTLFGFFFLFLLKRKKINTTFLFGVLINIVGVLFLLFHNNRTIQTTIQETNISDKILDLFQYIITDNWMIFLFFCIMALALCLRIKWKSKIVKSINCLYWGMGTILLLINGINILILRLNEKTSKDYLLTGYTYSFDKQGFLPTEGILSGLNISGNYFGSFYRACVFGITFIVFCFVLIKNSDIKCRLFFPFSIGCLAAMSTVFTEYISPRVCSLSVYMLIFMSVVMFNEQLVVERVSIKRNVQRLIMFLVIMVGVIQVDFFILSSNAMHKAEEVRRDRLEKVAELQNLGLWNYELEVQIPGWGQERVNTVVPGYNTMNEKDAHWKFFCSYYGISVDTKVHFYDM